MKATNILLKLLMLLSGTASLLVSTTEAVEADQACYGTNQALQCSQHRLQCQQGSIFILEAARGFKEKSNDCLVQRTSCTNQSLCCHSTSQDCLEGYTQQAFSDLAAECWNKASCSYRIPEANRAKCSNAHKSLSAYSNVRYLCLQGQAIQDFSDSKMMTATSMALRYQYDAEPGDYVCHVEAEDGSTQAVHITLVKDPNLYSSRPCTSLAVRNTDGLPCDAHRTRYATYTVLTPATVTLSSVKTNNVRQAWAVIHGHNLSALRITCEGSVPPTPSRQPAAPQSSPSSTSAAATSPTVTADDGQQPPAEDSMNKVATIGGIVGAVAAVVLLIVLIIICMCRRKAAARSLQQSQEEMEYNYGNLDQSICRRSDVPVGSGPVTVHEIFDMCVMQEGDNGNYISGDHFMCASVPEYYA